MDYFLKMIISFYLRVGLDMIVNNDLIKYMILMFVLLFANDFVKHNPTAAFFIYYISLRFLRNTFLSLTLNSNQIVVLKEDK